MVGGDSYFFFFAFDTVVDFLHHTVINATESTAIDAIRKDKGLLTRYLEECFAKEYYKTPHSPEPLTGYDYLTGEIILKLIDKTLEKDRALLLFPM